MNSVWAALFATGFGILLTTPFQYLVPTFLCGFAGRFVRDLFIGWGVSPNWSTLVAAAVVVLLAAAIVRRHAVSPVVLICGVLPLGASAAMFNVIFELMKLSSANGEALNGALVAFASNLAKVFTVSLAIALGIAAGLAIVRLTRRDEAVEV